MSSANNKGRMSRRKKMEPWYYVGPIFLLLVIMFGYPLIKSVVMAFQNYKLGNANVYFNDFANFHKMFGDKDFLLLLKNSVVYVVVSVFGQFIGGLILALCLRDKFKGRGIYQSIVFLPWAFSAFVVGLVFRWSFNGEYGVVNDVLMKLGIIKKGIAWLGTPGLSLVVVILAMIWIGIPFFGIISCFASSKSSISILKSFRNFDGMQSPSSVYSNSTYAISSSSDFMFPIHNDTYPSFSIILIFLYFILSPSGNVSIPPLSR